MPSREVVQVAAAGDDEPAAVMQSDVAMKENENVTHKVTETSTAAAQRKITPATDKKKNASLQKKAKQQASIASFFAAGASKRKIPSTPFLSSNDAKQQPTAKKQCNGEAAKQTASGASQNYSGKSQSGKHPTVTPSTSLSSAAKTATKAIPDATAKNPPPKVAATKSTSKKAPSRMKEFREVVVGNLTAPKSAKPSNDSDLTETASNEDGTMDSLLPRIPPVSSVASQQCKSSSSEDETTSAVDNSEPSDEHANIGGIRSQLVRKFDNPPDEMDAPSEEAGNDKEFDERADNAEETDVGAEEPVDDNRMEEEDNEVAFSDGVQGGDSAKCADETPTSNDENDDDKETPTGTVEESTSNHNADHLESVSKLDGGSESSAYERSNVTGEKAQSEKETTPAENADEFVHEAKSDEVVATCTSPGSDSASDDKENNENTSENNNTPKGCLKSNASSESKATKKTTEPQGCGGLMSFLKPKSELAAKKTSSSPRTQSSMETEHLAKKDTTIPEETTGKDTTAKSTTENEASLDTVEKNAAIKDATKGEAKTPSTASSDKNADACQKDAQPQLSPECQALLEKHETMRTKYFSEAGELVQQGKRGFEEEEFSISLPSTEELEDITAATSFPDGAVPHLASLVEGSKLPLSELTKHACEALNTAFSIRFSEECVSTKIKVLAERKPYVKNPAIGAGTSVSNNVSAATDLFEDASLEHVWRWEVASVDILPSSCVASVKKARSARKKFSIQFNAVARLLSALDESIKLMSKGAPPKAKMDKVVAKISKEEEKVLKHERDAEKARLTAEAKKKKEETAKEKDEEKKNSQKELKKIEAEKKKREKEEAKRQKALEREEAKRKKEEKEREEKAKKEREQERQKKRMMSFFAGPAKKAKQDVSSPKATEKTEAKPECPVSALSGFDVERFRSGIDSGEVSKPLFGSLSRSARKSLKRKSKHVKLTVFVSAPTVDNNPFAAQPVFAEEKEIEVRNRNKYLSFSEDLRPPYHGTWTKKSAVKNLGRKPFSKEPALNYDVDSEAEWEEGDDDPGEDVDNDAGDEEEDKDEEGDTRMYNYQDGWLAQDDDLGDEDELDEESKKLLRSRKRAEGSGFVPVCIIAPSNGGVPLPERYADSSDPVVAEKIEGFSVQQAFKLAAAHDGVTLVDADIYLDAFPPVLTEEKEKPSESTSNAQSNEPSEDDMKTIAKFIHHSNLVSKSQVVEELRNKHASVTSSRAQGFRILDSIAEKKRHPNVKNGVYWEVKQDILDNLGLDDLKAMKLTVEEATTEHQSSTTKKKVGSKKKKAETKKETGSKKKKAETKKETTEAKQEPKVPTATKDEGSAKKKPIVSAASATLFASFFSQKKK